MVLRACSTLALGLNAPTALIFPDAIGPTYNLAFHYPLLELYRRGKLNFAVIPQPKIASTELSSPALEELFKQLRPSVVVLSRFAAPIGLQIYKLAKQHGAKTFYHIDDLLLEIPPWIGPAKQKAHGNPEVIETRRALLASADCIWCSTKVLEDFLRKEFPKSTFTTTLYPPYLQGVLAPKTPSPAEKRELTIGYMGSSGHQPDLQLVVPALTKILRAHNNIRFETFGTIAMPEELNQFGNQVQHIQVRKNYEEFLRHLQAANWDLGLIPLQENQFNACKSMIKFLEYTLAGIPTLISSTTPYRENLSGEVTSFIDTDSWESEIMKLLGDERKQKDQLKNAEDFLSRRYSLSSVAEEMLGVLTP